MTKAYENVLCVIPARAGSKGIIDKNVKLFNGYPLFCWSIASALESQYIGRIVVSSDYADLDRLYANYCKPNSKIEWMDRPGYLCTDTSTTESCLCHVIENLQDEFQYVVTLQPTSPVRQKQMIDKALEHMISNSKKTLLSAKPCSPFFLQKLTDGNIKWHYNASTRKMRQELADEDFFWHDDGNLYITKVEVLMSTNCRLDHAPFIYENDELSSFQIDTELDFVILEKIRQELTCKNMYISP